MKAINITKNSFDHEVVRSEQKVLLDEFAIFNDGDRKRIVARFAAELDAPAAPTEYSSLTRQENELMGAFLALPPEKQDALLAELTQQATEEVRRQRKELF